ncbi:MAG: hypothetical protein C3F06_00040 [Candidatus Methanoperedenaceae archaeon]|nr:MAG: hypothetical protein C3F06_00040 [Candidatus Methanoperedenaceae archaeon]
MKKTYSNSLKILYLFFFVTIAAGEWNEPYFIIPDSDRPSIIQDNEGTYWIAFNSWTNPQNIWIVNSNDSLKWENFYQVTVSNMTDYAPNLIQDRNGTYWIVYASLVEIKGTLNFNYDIKLVKSNNGINWSEPQIITDSPVIESYPYLFQDQKGRFFLTYSSYQNESSIDLDIYMKYSDNGSNWSDPIRVTDSNKSDIFPIIIQDKNGTYWMMFTRDTYKRNITSPNKYDVFLITSNDGIHWSDIAQVTDYKYNINYPYFIQDRNGYYWIPHMTGISGSEELGIMGSVNGLDWTESRVLSNYSQEGYFKTDYKSMIQNTDGKFIYTFTSAKIGRGIWIMNGTPYSNNSITHAINFDIPRISAENDAGNPMKTIMDSNKSGMNNIIFFILIIISIYVLKKLSL